MGLYNWKEEKKRLEAELGKEDRMAVLGELIRGESEMFKRVCLENQLFEKGLFKGRQVDPTKVKVRVGKSKLMRNQVKKK